MEDMMPFQMMCGDEDLRVSRVARLRCNACPLKCRLSVRTGRLTDDDIGRLSCVVGTHFPAWSEDE